MTYYTPEFFSPSSSMFSKIPIYHHLHVSEERVVAWRHGRAKLLLKARGPIRVFRIVVADILDTLMEIFKINDKGILGI
jgi:hypothetical protein